MYVALNIILTISEEVGYQKRLKSFFVKLVFLVCTYFKNITVALVLRYLNTRLVHSHKKRKDNLETQAELAVLHAYVENQY